MKTPRRRTPALTKRGITTGKARAVVEFVKSLKDNNVDWLLLGIDSAILVEKDSCRAESD